MKNPGLAIKAVTILSSILLVAAYVAYSFRRLRWAERINLAVLPPTNSVPPAAVKHDPA